MTIEIENDVPVPTGRKTRSRKKTTLRQERTREPTHEMRSFESYELEDADRVDEKPWVRPTSLEAPAPRPGFVQRWIRVSSRGADDTTNASRKFRSGWKPRPAETVPPNHIVPTISHGKWAGAIGVEGMVLCEMPRKMYQKQRDAIAKKTKDVTDAIEAELQAHSRPGMPIYQDRRSVKVREVEVASDGD
jgi:hypothetical protein